LPIPIRTARPNPQPAVTVVEISDPTAVGEAIEMIEQNAV